MCVRVSLDRNRERADKWEQNCYTGSPHHVWISYRSPSFMYPIDDVSTSLMRAVGYKRLRCIFSSNRDLTRGQIRPITLSWCKDYEVRCWFRISRGLTIHSEIPIIPDRWTRYVLHPRSRWVARRGNDRPSVGSSTRNVRFEEKKGTMLG